MSELYQDVRAAVDGIALVDSHEHVVSEEVRLGLELDLFHWFSHGAAFDLISAGMPEPTLAWLQDAQQPLDKRWAAFAPYWVLARSTGFGRALLLAARELFGVNDISNDTYEELSQRLSASNHKGWYEHVLRERANIQLAILDPLQRFDPTPLEQIDRRYFVPVLRVDEYLAPCNRWDLLTLEAKCDVSIHSLDDLLKALNVGFTKGVAAGVVAIKVALAYRRPLRFEKVTRARAEELFNRLFQFPVNNKDFEGVAPVSWAEARPLQDYLMHQTIRLAIEHGLPIQFHTGLQEGTGNFLGNSNPLQLVNLFCEYREARFDLFHAAYPYQGHLAALAKCFSNVYIDMCWMHVISPWAARQTLHEWIETVPANKIFAFGGDYAFVEGVYAHSRIARDNVASVLCEKIEAGYLSEDEAIGLARRLLRGNCLDFYNLELQA